MRDHRGFTLLEVLMILVLIGVLAGISIQQYAVYRARSYDSRVAAAVRGVATGEEAYFASHEIYASDLDDLDKAMVAGDVAITILPGNSGSLGSSFRVVGTHPEGRSHTWISDPLPGSPNLTVNDG